MNKEQVIKTINDFSVGAVFALNYERQHADLADFSRGLTRGTLLGYQASAALLAVQLGVASSVR